MSHEHVVAGKPGALSGRIDGRGRCEMMEFLAWLIMASTAVPMLKLLPHFGINKYWAAICVIPLGVAALIWWMGLKLQDLEKL